MLAVGCHVGRHGRPLPRCRSRLVLKEGAKGFGNASALKPVVATDNGFDRNVSSHRWWEDTVDKNMLFYAQVHNLGITLGASNAGATGILWGVAQQTSLRNLTIEAGGGYASRAVQHHPNGGDRFDFACLPARTMHPHGACA